MFGAIFLDALLNMDVVESMPMLDSTTLFTPNPPSFEDLLIQGVQMLPLPDNMKFQVDDVLNQFKSADFKD